MQATKPLSQYRLSLKEKILHTAMNAFATQGIKAVKMDDLAKQLGISKRTLYEIYDNKEVLLFESVKAFKRMKDEELSRLVADSSNVMDIILEFYKMKVEDFKRTSPEFYSDISIYPQVMSFLDVDKHEGEQRFMKFLHRGVGEGYFRSDVDYHFVTIMFDALINYVMNRKLYQQYTIEQIFQNIVFVSLRGFCTPKGIDTLDAFLFKD